MDHTSFVASIIKHGLSGDIAGIRNYANALVERLQKDGEDRQAAIIDRAASGALPAPEKMISPPEIIGFPKLPEYKGCWSPVYWTPIMGSGERLTVFLVARGDDGQTSIIRTIRDEVLVVSFGEQAAEGLRKLFALIEKDLTAWLLIANPYTDQCNWTAPITGFLFGGWRKSQSDNVDQLAAQAICMEAAFADRQSPRKSSELTKESAEDSENLVERKRFEQWHHATQGEWLVRNPQHPEHYEDWGVNLAWEAWLGAKQESRAA